MAASPDPSRPTPAGVPPDATGAAGHGPVVLSPAVRAELLDPTRWQDVLEGYARSTQLAVALVDPAGQLLGRCHNPQPVWSLARAAQPAGACLFCLPPLPPCTAVAEALRTGQPVLTRDQAGLAHAAVPLCVEGECLAVLLAGQVFDQFPESLPLDRLARACGLAPHPLWQLARQQPLVSRERLQGYSALLATLGQAVLRVHYDALLERQRAAAMLALSQAVAARTEALDREMAARQRLEREAQRAQHFAMLGRLAAGVSHEIRNPLGAIFLQVDLLTEELQQPSPDSATQVAEALTAIKTELVRLDDLVQDYLSLVRVGTIERTPQDLQAAVQAWSAEFQAWTAGRGVQLQVDGLETLGAVAFHASTLRRALLNLVQNAVDAVPPGGTVTLAGHGTATQVQLRVHDTGRGIPDELLPQIFEPLYTTKPGGTGLGLYIVQQIVQAHDGEVTVESAAGRGTTVTLTLPRAAATPSAEPGQSPASPAPESDSTREQTGESEGV
jgi:signal transduction histidine kinase